MQPSVYTLKQGDTDPIRATLKFGTGHAQDLTGATVKFNMRRLTEVIVDHGDCTVVGSATNGIVEYAPPTPQSWEPGDYEAEFEVLLPNSKTRSFPHDSNIVVRVVAQVA